MSRRKTLLVIEPRLLRYRQPDGYSYASPFCIISDSDVATMPFADNTPSQSQPYSGSASAEFSSEAQFKDAVQNVRLNARASIANLNEHLALLTVGHDGQLTAAFHRFNRIVQYVAQDLSHQ